MALLNNNLCRKVNRFGHILRRNCLLHDVIEEQIIRDRRGKKKTKTAPRQFEKQKMMLGAKAGRKKWIIDTAVNKFI